MSDKISSRENFAKIYRFGYKNGASSEKYSFVYDFIIEVYHEQVETIYVLEKSDINPHIHNLRFVKEFSELEKITERLLKFKSKDTFKHINMYWLTQSYYRNICSSKLISISPEGINDTSLHLNKKLLTHEENKLGTVKSDIIGKLNGMKIIYKENINRNLDFLIKGYLDVIHGYGLTKIKNHAHVLSNHNLVKEKSSVHLLSDYIFDKVQSQIRLLLDYIFDKVQSQIRLLLDYIFDKERQNHISPISHHILSKEHCHENLLLNLALLLAREQESIWGAQLNRALKLEQIAEISYQEFSVILYLMNTEMELYKTTTDYKVKTYRQKEALINHIDEAYLKELRNMGIINIVAEYNRPLFYSANEDQIEQYVNREVIRTTLVELLENLPDRDAIRNILAEIVLRFAIKDTIKNLKHVTNDIDLERDLLGNVLKESVDIKAIKKFFKDLGIIEDLEKLLDTDAQLDILEQELLKLLSGINNNALITNDSFLKKYMEIIGVILDESINLKRKNPDSIVEENIFLKFANKDIVYTEETLLFANMKLIDVEDDRQLKLWKRFWFLYAGDEIDRKILPYRDFPYESEPIEFEGNDHLYPENWNVTHPHEFWKKISYHPVADGTGEALDEMDVAINIMIEIINVLILMWGRHYSAFWGWTGTQAVVGIAGNVYEWLRLETSIQAQKEKKVKSHYDRCFRWLRWEVEKVALMARDDMELRGNHYVGLLIEEMINYMLDHHFNVMPLFEDVNKMDEWRRSFERDLQGDIPYVLDKVKGIRRKLIEGKERKANA